LSITGRKKKTSLKKRCRIKIFKEITFHSVVVWIY